MKGMKKASVIPIVLGIILLITGFCISVPGNALTTEEILNGKNTTYYTFDDKYSAIDEYVGGDAYNFIIGASLVAGKTSGAMISRSVYFTGGMLCVCAGAVMYILGNEKEKQTELAKQEEEKKDVLPEL